MRRILSIVIAATLLLGAQSCEDIDVVKEASISCLTQGFNDGGSTTLAEWNKGEQIYLYRGEDWSSALFNLTSGAGSSTATFAGSTAGTKAGYYALRPAKAAGAIRNNSEITINVEPTNIFFAEENSSTAVPQIGKGNAGGLTFSPIFGALKFNIEGVNSVSFVQVSVPNEDRGVYGTFQYKLADDTIYGKDVEHKAERTCSPAMDISSSKCIYVALPPGGYKAVDLLISDDESGEKFLYRAQNIAVRRGTVMSIPSSSYVYVPKVVGRWHLKSYCGKAAPVDLYIEFTADYKFTILQRSGSAGYVEFKGAYTEDKDSATISGTYSDGESWGESYRYLLSDNMELILTSTSNNAEVSVYEEATMPKVNSAAAISRADASSVKPL